MDGLVLVAAGASRRFGGKQSKVLRSLAGKPVVVRALAPFLVAVERLSLVVVTRAEDRSAFRRLFPKAIFTDGGSTRAESVRHGIEALPKGIETILVHDAARPLVTADVVRRVLRSARRHGAAAAVARVNDSLHVVEGATEDAPAWLREPVDRSRLVAAQTPQAASAALLRRAYLEAGDEASTATDEVNLLHRAGIPAVAVRGNPRNIKITTDADLALAEQLLAESTE